MKNHRFGTRSKERLTGVHPDLVALCYRALFLSPHDFSITEGLRDIERQKNLVAQGKSTTLHSYHLTGKAIDFAVVAGGKLTWDLDFYRDVAAAFQQAASEYGVSITWGGDWKTFVDGPHIQMEG
jgi:peptidoglycan L-alanyl-D-glutamate endopeptidase CwlK